jgi:hypothetical protein
VLDCGAPDPEDTEPAGENPDVPELVVPAVLVLAVTVEAGLAVARWRPTPPVVRAAAATAPAVHSLARVSARGERVIVITFWWGRSC